MDEQNRKIEQLAQDVLRLSRNTLLVHLRFLDRALSALTPVKTDAYPLCTDGIHLGYSPKYILRCYKEEKERPTRDYLHVVFHSVFRHMFIHHLLDRDCWDLACDIAVEQVISELDLRMTETKRQSEQKHELENLNKYVKHMTAETLYRYFQDNRPSEEELARLKELFSADDHQLWHLPPKRRATVLVIREEKQDERQRPSKHNGGGDGKSDEDEDADDENGEESSASSDEQDIEIGVYGEKTAAQAEDLWKDISESLQQNLETFSSQRGDQAGNLVQNLAEVNRERYDYSEFLKKFAVRGEVMRLNPEEFDYVYYTYGLRLYEQMPLIEPLEYREDKRIREFVIAIDTSGSTSGELVQRFLQKTYNILQQSESFFSKVNIHIIQCDADIQDDTKITCREDFDLYLKTMQLHGLGGTDFRPVFAYVDSLIWNKEFQNLKGLIYFTDGFGTFPNIKPVYDTAFIFVENDDFFIPEVPPWAIKLVLQKEDI